MQSSTVIEYSPNIPAMKCYSCGSDIRWGAEGDFVYQWEDDSYQCEYCFTIAETGNEEPNDNQ